MKLHLPKMLTAALIAAITAVGSSAFAEEAATTTFTTTNLSSAGTTNNFNTQGFVITLDGSRLETTSNPSGASIDWCDEVNLVSITLNNLRNNPPSGDHVGLALANASGVVLSLSDNSASGSGKFTWNFTDTTVATDSPLYFYFYKTTSAPMTVGQTLTATDLYQNGCGGSGVSVYGDGSDSISCGFLNGVSSVQSVQFGPKLSIVTTGIPAEPDKYVWAGTESGAAWDTQTENWTVNGSAVMYKSAADTVATFGTEAVAKTVTVSENIQAGQVSVEDNYTFTVESDSSLTVGKLAVADGKTATVAGEGTVTLGSFTGKLAIEEGATVNTTGTITLTATQNLPVSGKGTLGLTTLQVTGGTHTITNGLNITGGGDGKGSDPRKQGLAVTGGTVTLEGDTHISGAMYNAVGTVNIGNGTDKVRVTTNRVEFGDAGGTGESILNIKANATLHVKGTDQVDAYASTALVMGEWNGVSTANIAGKLYADNATAYVGDSTVTFNIEKGGLMAVKGFSLNQFKTEKTETINLNLKDGGKLVLGANGIASQKPINVSFAAGEVGISADSVTIAKDIVLSGTSTTFNTAKYVWQGENDTRELVAGDEGGTLTISGNITGDGTITKIGEGTLVLSGANNVLTHTIAANAGSMTLNGSYEIADITPTGGKTTYTGGQNEGNGYATATGSVTVYDGAAKDSVNADAATFTYHGSTVDVTDGVYTLPGTQDTSTYYINNKEDSYSWIDTNKKGELTGGIVVAESAYLRADKDMSMSVVAASSKGTVNIDDGVVVTAAGGTQNVALVGAGTYALASGAQTLGSVNVDDFQGYVRLSGNIANIDLKGNLGSNNVEFKGLSGHFKNLTEGTVDTYNGNIRLVDDGDTPAIKITDGYSRNESEYIFAGDISGEGTWELNCGATQHYVFTGSLEDWTGEFKVTNSGPNNNGTSLAFRGDATTVNAAITRNGGTLKLIVENDATFRKNVTGITSLTVSEGKEATFNGGTTSIGSLIGAGDVTVNGDLTLTGTTTTSSEAEGATNFTGTLTSNGNITVATSGVVTISGDSTFVNVITNSGTVHLNGITLDTEYFQQQGGDTDAHFNLNDELTTDDNYFVGTSEAFVQVVSGGTSDTTGITWDGNTYDTLTNGKIVTGEAVVDHTTFYVGGEISTSAINASEHVAAIENINVGDGATLTVDEVVEQATIHAGDGATVAGEHAQDRVMIDAGAEVKYAYGITSTEGVYIFGLDGVSVTNNSGYDAKYGLDNDAMAVEADALSSSVNDEYVVNNQLSVSTVTHQGEGELTLAHVNGDALSVVETDTADLILQGITATTLSELTIGAGATVAVYTDELAQTEGTVTIDAEGILTAGAGTLRADLTLEGGSTLDVNGGSVEGGTQNALTLGSTLTVNTTTGFINLDNDTLIALDGLGLGQRLTLVKALDGSTLTYGDDGYNGTWYSQMFNREGSQYTLEGDFQVFAEADGFGLVKVNKTPEPTTGTLSLLALAALAARRRRK